MLRLTKSLLLGIVISIALFQLVGTVLYSEVQASVEEDWTMFRKNPAHTGYSEKETSLKPPLQVKWSRGASGRPNSPVVADGIVYIEFAGTLYARDTLTGETIWVKGTPKNDRSSVAVAYGMVFDGSPCTTDAAQKCGMVAYDAKTGEEKWRIDLPRGARGPNVSDGVVYFYSDDWYVRAMDAYTGQLLWTSPKLNDGGTAVPAVANGKVFVGTWRGMFYALNSTDGQILWQLPTGGVMFSSPSVVNNTVYVGSGTQNVYAIDATNGTIKWTYSGGKDSMWGSPSIAYGNLYIQDLAGHIHALNSNDGSLLWLYKTGAKPSSSDSSTAVANGIVYVGSQDKSIYGFDAYTGEVLWRYETGGDVRSSPAVAKGMLYVGSNDGFIYAFANEAPPPPPTTKVVVTPGMGASWNADAILNCELDEKNYEGGWTLASFAEDIYTPLLTSLDETEYEIFPFYYDWRKKVLDNGGLLTNFIDGEIVDGEKVHLVGHSMGGLVGRAYLENEAESNKLDKYLSVGSPHKGSPLAYPAWSGGKMWNDNFLTKIATSLLIKRCKSLDDELKTDKDVIREKFPSINNLLPTEDYLRNKKSGNLIPIENMTDAINDWLPTDFPFYGAEIGTLSGDGFETLEVIKVRNRNKRDLKLDNWEHGRPAGKEFSLEGDGTVLLDSSQVIDAENRIINQDHSGLVNSTEGISEIFDFLGIGLPAVTSASNPESALIIAGYPASFVVTDPNGKIKKDKESLVSFINPKKGNYKIALLPESDKTLLVVGQFLKNGKYKWKEYNLKNKLPKFGQVTFDSENLLKNPYR